MSKHQIAVELHGAARRNYTRRRVNVYAKNDLFQADLVEMIPYSRENKGYKYILCVIDCFTKFAWAVTLKSKKVSDVTVAAETIFSHRRPRLLHVDRGKEFYNTNFQTLLKKYNVKMYSTYQWRAHGGGSGCHIPPLWIYCNDLLFSNIYMKKN